MIQFIIFYDLDRKVRLSVCLIRTNPINPEYPVTTNLKRVSNLKFLSAFVLLSGLLFGCSSSTTLKWHQEKNYRWATVDPGYFGHTGFKQLSPSKTGINFKNTITEKEIAENRQYLNGSGVAAGDINGDGLVDLYFCNLNGPNKLYLNMGGMRFKDITKEAGVGLPDYHSTGAVFADVDGDGDLDLIVTSLGQGNVIFLNDGKGHFTLDKHSGLEGKKGSMTMTLADINGDGYPDLYIANYKKKSVKDIYPSKQLSNKHILKKIQTKQGIKYKLVPPFDKQYRIYLTKSGKLAGVAEIGEKDQLYLNQGNGTFKLATDTKNIFLNDQGKPFGLQPDWGLTARFHDLNNDGLPDLYVCNDFFTPDRVWINQGNGTFKEINWSSIRNASFSSMSVAIGDINDDGLPDLFVTEMLSPNHKRRLTQMGSFDLFPSLMGQMKARPQYNRNSLYLQREDGTFAEISYLSGLEATGWSWGTKFMDVNLDGYPDLIVNTGYYKNILDIDTQQKMINQGLDIDDNYGKFIRMAPPLKLTNKIFMNNGNLTFTDKSSDWGFTKPDISQGMAAADLDNDGDLDLISNRLNETAAVYENKTTAPRIAVKLKGLVPNTQGIGAKIKLLGGAHRQEREISAGGDYLSGSQAMAMFAATKPDAHYTIVVDWRDGYRSKINDVEANRIYEITEPDHQPVPLKKGEVEKTPHPLFKDVSSLIGYKHHENTFRDYELQPLLPFRLSRLGPGVAWFDLNNNGYDDFFEATGKGGKMGGYENSGNDTFRTIKGFPFDKIAHGDQSAVIGWNTSDGANLLVGNAN
ncbi:MAG TPA: CRTAC1 family protein, partial [Balneolales bacterium]|nr:CRTAC1 family protein [Balneolales bacterium]